MPEMKNPYEAGLEKTSANYQALTPIIFLERAANVFPNTIAVVHAQTRMNYGQFWRRSLQLASALNSQGIKPGDTVSVLLSNTPPMLEAHFGVPMAGAVLHSINTRLDAASIAFQLDHADSKILIVDREFSALAMQALSQCQSKPLVIDYDDPEYPSDAPYSKGPLIGDMEYEDLIAHGSDRFSWRRPDDEWDAISLNYTSGTTGNPKGVVFHHRGAALAVYANTIHADLRQHSVYLWTLPMFHCNGWCFTWTLPLTASTHVCLRWVRAKAVYELIDRERVTVLCGAPTVMGALLNAPEADKRKFSQTVTFNTAAAPPPKAIMAAMAANGFRVIHLYGLTETYGPSVVNYWKQEWDQLDTDAQAEKMARQGIPYAAMEGLTVRHPDSLAPVPADGQTLGEVMMRGNIVMKGYLKNPAATQEAFSGGWFHSGDLGVMHPDGYIELRDRSKDIIISGGENISSIEVEDALYRHPSVAACGVVGRHDDRWGEVPVAYVELKPNMIVSEAELLEHCRNHLARFKCPKSIIFRDIPKTSTGKIQKYLLRE
jgi:fatty-acyl-CoA synthase